MQAVDHPAADAAVVDEDRVRAPEADPLRDLGRERHGVEAGVALVGPRIAVAAVAEVERRLVVAEPRHIDADHLLLPGLGGDLPRHRGADQVVRDQLLVDVGIEAAVELLADLAVAHAGAALFLDLRRGDQPGVLDRQLLAEPAVRLERPQVGGMAVVAAAGRVDEERPAVVLHQDRADVLPGIGVGERPLGEDDADRVRPDQAVVSCPSPPSARSSRSASRSASPGRWCGRGPAAAAPGR